MAPKEASKAALPSSNWLALHKKLESEHSTSRKKRKTTHTFTRETPPTSSSAPKLVQNAAFPRGTVQPVASTSTLKVEQPLEIGEMKNGESVDELRKMIMGDSVLATGRKGAKKYVAIDCEMVGVGIDGAESSLARVSVVNFYGEVELDEIVQQRERVVDYRTKWSGIRAADMVRAKPFAEVQKSVASLIEGKVLVGHAVHNDLKALLLSHPHYLLRDTQVLAGKHKVVGSRKPALRHLVEHEFGVAIQEGEHSSVIDARATMAVYRLHRKVWESSLPKSHLAASSRSVKNATKGSGDDSQPADTRIAPTRKRKADRESADLEDDSSPPTKSNARARTFPGGGRKGVSSGLSTVIKRREQGKPAKASWWKDLS